MSDYDLNGPWTGAALKPSLPYSVRRRRAWMRALMVIAGIMALIGGGLAGLSHV